MAQRTAPWRLLGALALLLLPLLAAPVRAVVAPPDPELVPGALAYTWYQGQWNRLPDLSLESPSGYGIAPGVSLDPIPATEDFAVRFTGYLSIHAAGEYRFSTTSDDGSALYIDDQRVVNNDGLHGLQTKTGRVTLAPGTHRLRVEFFQRGGGQGLSVTYRTPAGVTAPLPTADLAYDPTVFPAPREAEQPIGARYAGLAYAYHEGDWSALPAFDALTPRLEGASAGFDLAERLRDDRYGMRFQGFIEVPRDGLYTFYTASDDGSALYIGDQRVVNNDGLHPLRERAGVIDLNAGLHRITVDYFEKSGEDSLAVEWSGPELAKTPIAPTDLFYTLDLLPPLKPAEVPTGPLLPRLAYRYFEGEWSGLPDFTALVPKAAGTADGLDLRPALRADRFGMRYQGYIRVPADGVYRFTLESDNASRLAIGGTALVENTGAWNAKKGTGGIALAAGVHAITVDYKHQWGTPQLSLSYRTPDGGTGALPLTDLMHTADQLPALQAAVSVPEPLPGIAYAWYEGSFNGFPAFDTLSARAHGTAAAIDLTQTRRDSKFALRFQGWLQVGADGFYRVHLRTGGGTRVWIGDTLVAENPGRSWQTVVGSVGLAAGLHPLRVEYYQGWGEQPFELTLETPTGERAPLGAADLRHTAAQLPPLAAALTPPAAARPGLAYRYFEGAWKVLPDFTALPPAGLGVVPGFSLERAAVPDNYGFSFTGLVQIPADGFYDFYTNSDDGSRLWIDDTLVVDNDGLHSAQDALGNRGLAAGWHRIRVDYFERWSDDHLAVTWRAPGGARVPLPADALVYDPATLPTLKAADAARDALLPGIQYAYYEWTKGKGDWQALPNLAALTPTATGTQDGFSLAPRRRNNRYAFRFTGYIDIPEYGYYSFYTTSDDGSRLWIGDQLVVDNDGLHGARERSGRIGLERGRHAITVTFFEWEGEDSLTVAYAGPRFGKATVDPAVLFRLDPARNGDPGDPGAPEGPTDPTLNHPPTPGLDQAATGIGAGQGLTLDPLANDSDPDGDIPQLIGADASGAAGAAYVDRQRGRLVYYPPLGFVGEDRIAYRLSDRRGGLAQGEVQVQVGATGPAPRIEPAAAARLLTQASFGPTKAELAQVMQQGPAAWVDAQLALTPSLHTAVLGAVRGTGTAPSNRELRVRAWLDRAVKAPDQLRQRVAFALSEILVVSDTGTALATQDGALGALDYYDLLVRGAFGSYRQLLGEVTLHPAMGLYLNMAGNRKADPLLGTVPDENFAREVLQLFSLGLWQLAPDGSRLLDAAGQPRPSYTQAEVMEFARVFTGWDFAAATGVDRYRLPLVLDPSQHEDAAKRLLNGVELPAGQGGATDLDQALDNIAAHPNLPPFIARQLIQRLVTSNPSPAYVGRAAAAFSASDLNLGQLVRAILLDPEARTASPDPLAAPEPLEAAADPTLAPALAPTGPAYGKVREPLLQLTALWRALGVDPAAIRLRLDQLAPLGQTPLSAPSVFNFFKPDYQSPGEISELGLYSPELELINEKQVVNSARVIDDWTLGGAQAYDLNMELAFAATGGAKAVEHLGLLLLAGAPSEGLRQTLLEEVFDQQATAGSDADRITRMLAAAYLILTSPEFQTQR